MKDVLRADDALVCVGECTRRMPSRHSIPAKRVKMSAIKLAAPLRKGSANIAENEIGERMNEGDRRGEKQRQTVAGRGMCTVAASHRPPVFIKIYTQYETKQWRKKKISPSASKRLTSDQTSDPARHTPRPGRIEKANSNNDMEKRSLFRQQLFAPSFDGTTVGRRMCEGMRQTHSHTQPHTHMKTNRTIPHPWNAAEVAIKRSIFGQTEGKNDKV